MHKWSLNAFAAFLLSFAVTTFWPHLSHADVRKTPSISDTAKACLVSCKAKIESEQGIACYTKSHLEQCLEQSYECLAVKFSGDDKVVLTELSYAFGQRMCDCGVKTQVAPPSSPSPTPSGAVAKPPVKKPLTEKEACKNHPDHGIWVESPQVNVVEKDGEKVEVTVIVPRCYTLRHAWEEIQALKKRLAEGGDFTPEEIERLKMIVSVDPKEGMPLIYGWEGDLNAIARGLEAICRLPAEEETALRAKLESDGKKFSIVIACEAMRQKILDAEKRSKEALDKSNQAISTAEGAKNDAKQAIDTANRADETAKRAEQKADKAVHWSLLRVSGMAGIFFVPTPEFQGMGDDLKWYGGGEISWYPKVSPDVRLALNTFAAYSNEIYVANSAMVGVGVGIGTDLSKTVLIDVQAVGWRFLTDREFTRASFYGGAPEIVWAPFLATGNKVGFVLSGSVPIGMSRYGAPDGQVVERFDIGARIGAGIGFGL